MTREEIGKQAIKNIRELSTSLTDLIYMAEKEECFENRMLVRQLIEVKWCLVDKLKGLCEAYDG